MTLGSGFDSEPWNDFAVATAGAAAALVGLLFVALSINLQAVVTGRHLPGRAAYTLVLLATPLFVALVLLVPQNPTALGIELVVLAAVVGPALGWLGAPGHRPADSPATAWALGVIGPALILTVSVLLAGVGLLTTSIGGLFWLPAAVVFALLGGLFNAWVLLVEIVR